MTDVIRFLRESLCDCYEPDELKSLSHIICRDILGLSTSEIYSGKDTNLSESQLTALKSVTARLRRFEPIQYIIEQARFYRLDFRVSPDVLIPRPETEELVDLVLSENPVATSILDIGTGSGCIAISLSHNLPDAYIEAWDISEAALAVARQNDERLNTRVVFRQNDVMADEPAPVRKFDLIVSNPPYITEKEKKDMDANVLDWEPAGALFVPDDDPLRFYHRIALLGHNLLAPRGRLYFEINRAYAHPVMDMLLGLNYKNIKTYKDLFNNDRIVTACQ